MKRVTALFLLFYISSVYISQAQGLIINAITIKHVSCFGDTDGKIVINVANGFQPYIFTWSNGVTHNPPSSKNDSIERLAPGVYSIIVSDANGNSGTASYSIFDSPVQFTSQPASVSVMTGSTAKFGVEFYGTSPVYQWQSDLGFGYQNLTNAGQYSGVTSDTLVVSNINLSNNNQHFRCIVSTTRCTDTSDVVILTVTSTGIYDLNKNSDLIIYPNPSDGSFNVKVSALSITSFTLRNIFGQVIIAQDNINGSQNIDIHLPEIERGVYVISFVGETNVREARIIIR